MDEQLSPQEQAQDTADQRELLAAVSVGIEAERFLNSTLGRYLLSRMEMEVQEAFTELANADPEDAKTIRAHQNAIWRAESIHSWLTEAIQEGAQAERIYESGEG